MATTTTDILETKYTLKDSYSPGVRKAAAATRDFGHSVSSAKSHISMLAGALGLAGAAAIGVKAVKAAADFEQLTVTLEMLTGSSEAAASKLKFLEQLAIPSTFTFDELAKAGVQLESFKLRIEKVMPLLAKLGAAFPNKDIDEAARLFGRLATGDFPDIEVMSGFGLNKAMFAEEGIKFDANGKMLSTAEEALDALARIVNKSFGGILERMAGTSNAKFATLADMWTQGMRKLGEAILPVLNPIVEKLTAFFKFMISGGGLEKVLGGFTKLFDGKALGDGLVKMLMFVVAILEELPSIIQNVWQGLTKQMKMGADPITSFFMAIGNGYVSMINLIGNAFTQILNWVLIGIGTIMKAVDVAIRVFSLRNEPSQIGDLAKDLMRGPLKFNEMKNVQNPFDAMAQGNAFGALGKDRDNVMSRSGELFQAFQQFQAGQGPVGLPEGSEQGPWGKLSSPLGEIAENTSKIAENTGAFSALDLKRYVVGGGPLAQVGMTPVELGMARRGNRNGTVHVEAGGRKLNEAISEIVTQAVFQMQRQGQIPA